LRGEREQRPIRGPRITCAACCTAALGGDDPRMRGRRAWKQVRATA